MLSPFLKPGEQGSNTLAGFLTPLYTNRPSQNISGRMSFFVYIVKVTAAGLFRIYTEFPFKHR